MMDDLEASIHRTLVQYLVDIGFREMAALLIDAEIAMPRNFDEVILVALDIPPAAYNFVTGNEAYEEAIKQSLRIILKGRITSDEDILMRVKLVEVEENWKEVIRNIIVNTKDPNQASVTEILFAKEQKQPYLYNEMKFASKSEIRIAQELEKRKILFFPLPLAVRNDTGKRFIDHREPDFLVCKEGVWGIIEVAFHPNRFEKDVEKDSWFKKSGILCVQHYSAERCYEKSS